MPSRRQFIASSAAAITAASLPKFLLAQRRGGDLFTPGSLGAYTQGILTQDTFTSTIGSVFTAFLDNDLVAYLTLMKIVDANSLPTPSPLKGIARPAMASLSAPRASAPSSSAMELVGFQLAFNNGGAVFDQGTYLLDSGTLGRFACFLVPGMSSGGPTSCATFCTLTAAAPAQPLPIPIKPGW